jgi:diacylglycerol O-acyltransferase / wax synthase
MEAASRAEPASARWWQAARRRLEGEGTPLGGADIFHVRTDAELVSGGHGRNVCVLLAEIDGPIDRAALEARLAAGPPELGWRLGRGLSHPWLWRPSGPGATLIERPFEGDAVAAARGLLGEAAIGDSPFRVALLRGAQRDAVALIWFHAATDAKGASRLLGWLGGDAPLPDRGRHQSGDRLIAKLDRPARRELTQAYVDHVLGLAGLPILSLDRATPAPPGMPRALRIRLSVEETAAFDASLRKRAGLADTSLILWAATRLFDGLVDRRGYSPPQHLVPVPLSLDPKNDDRRMFGNHLTMMFLALDRDDLRDEARAVASLARQRREIVRQKLDAGMIAAMGATAWMPWRFVDFVSRRPFGGVRSSFVLSNPGDLGLSTFQGQRICDAFTLPMVLASPGFQVTTDRHGGRLSVMIAYREGLVARGELEAARDRFIADLLG